MLFRRSFSSSVVRQQELNDYEVGPIFDETINFAHLFALLFFCMTFAPGLPLITPILSVVFALYFMQDKYLLLRWFQKPPAVGTKLMRVVLDFMAYAAVIRLGFACWMLSSAFDEDYGKNIRKYFYEYILIIEFTVSSRDLSQNHVEYF